MFYQVFFFVMYYNLLDNNSMRSSMKKRMTKKNAIKISGKNNLCPINSVSQAILTPWLEQQNESDGFKKLIKKIVEYSNKNSKDTKTLQQPK